MSEFPRNEKGYEVRVEEITRVAFFSEVYKSEYGDKETTFSTLLNPIFQMVLRGHTHPLLTIFPCMLVNILLPHL